ncbi:hypothetical protein [Sedimentisphaera salicampi]|uniref:hypothetical protein n=1 Tax=Sedimentisphaera salicampi TaxID=1941349 RepID=UPI000B9A35D0|nr:hypothetical protein [Sedimentisphaera salicampi]OXU14750.1 hypothetical protein SMSP1_01487 [Sedimentisphaera salicampi]
MLSGIQKGFGVRVKIISTKQLFITLIPSTLVLLGAMAASIFFQVSMPSMTRDVTAIANIHPLSGALSNLGMVLWCVSAAVCGFAAIILRGFKPIGTFWFLLCSSLLSAYLLVDDLFLIHEVLSPCYLGLCEEFVFSALGIVLIGYIIVFRRIIMQTHFGALFLSLGFLAASAVIDVIVELLFGHIGQWMFFFEDGAKWLGIAFWCSYFLHTSYHLLVNTLGINRNAVQAEAPS